MLLLLDDLGDIPHAVVAGVAHLRFYDRPLERVTLLALGRLLHGPGDGVAAFSHLRFVDRAIGGNHLGPEHRLLLDAIGRVLHFVVNGLIFDAILLAALTGASPGRALSQAGRGRKPAANHRREERQIRFHVILGYRAIL